MPITDPTTRKLWRKLRRKDCTRCPLHETAQTVCLLGNGPTPAKLMAIGEAPGAREDGEAFEPFAGKAGQVLDAELEKNGIPRRLFYVTNAVKCRPPNNRKPKKAEMVACNVFLRAELRIHKPKYVLLLGAEALSATLGMQGLMANRQRVIKRDGVNYFVALHPAAGLHRPAYRQLFEDDIAAFARVVRKTQESDETTVHLVNDDLSFRRFLKKLEAEPVMAFDIENDTSGGAKLYPAAGGKRSTLTMCGFSFVPGEAYVVILDHEEGWASKKWEALTRELAVRMFVKGKKLIAHNGPSDLRWFLPYVPEAEYTFDTMYAAFLLNENRSMSLENLSLQELKVKPWKSDVKYVRDFPLKKYAIYNAKDCDYTLRLYHLYREELRKQSRLGKLLLTLLMPAGNLFARIEAKGIYIPGDRLDERTQQAYDEEKELLEQIRSFVPSHFKVRDNKGRVKPFNPGSSEQMARLLYSKDGLNLPFPVEASLKARIANKGLGSTAESTMVFLNHPIAKVIERWRYIKTKALATYFLRWKKLRGADGYVHFNYNLIGAVTGRISSDLHQVPRDTFVRGVLSVEDGWEWGAADFSQAEMRVAGSLSKDETLIDIYRTGKDVHTEAAIELTRKPREQIVSEDRKKAKGYNFGFLYGMFGKKFKQHAKEKFDLDVTLKEANTWRDSFFARYKRIGEWHDRVKRYVRIHGYVPYLNGRLRRLPDIWSENWAESSEAERQAINSPVQGIISDCAIFTMVVGQYGGYGFKPIVDENFEWMGQLHDEVIFRVRKGYRDQKARELKYLMEHLPTKKAWGFEFLIPLVAELKFGQYWGEAKEWHDPLSA